MRKPMVYSNNSKHKYWILNYNGFRLATSVSLPWARRIAKDLCMRDRCGMPIQVCWRENRTNYIRWFRDSRGYPKMHFSNTGMWVAEVSHA